MSAMAKPHDLPDRDTPIGQRLTRADELVKLNEQALADARAQRDAVICEAVDEHGWTQYRVANLLGYSERMVHKVLARATGPADVAGEMAEVA